MEMCELALRASLACPAVASSDSCMPDGGSRKSDKSQACISLTDCQGNRTKEAYPQRRVPVSHVHSDGVPASEPLC